MVPARQKQFIQEHIFENAPFRRNAIARTTNSEFTGSYTENPFSYQHFDLRTKKLLRGGPAIVNFDAADNWRFYVVTMKAMSFQDDFPSIAIDDFKDLYDLLTDLTIMQDAIENCHLPELVKEPLGLELNFTFSLEHDTELLVLGERMSLAAVDKFTVLEKRYVIWVMFVSNNYSTVLRYSNIGTLVHFPLTTFQLLIKTLLLLSACNPANARWAVSIG